MIKFGIPSIRTDNELFPGKLVLTVHRVEADKSKRRFSISSKLAEALKVVPGISKVGFSFEGGNYIAVVTDVEGVANADKLLVSKELSFISKKAHEFMCSHFDLPEGIDSHLEIEKVEDMYGLSVASFTGKTITAPTSEGPVAPVTEEIPASVFFKDEER